MKKSLALILIILLQNCVSDGYKKERDYRLLDASKIANDDAIVITKVDVKYTIVAPLATRLDSGFTEMNWCRDDEKKKCSEVLYFSPFSKVKFHSDYNSIYAVNSGIYYLEKIKEEQAYLDDWYLLPIKITFDIATFGAMVKPNFNTQASGWNKKLNSPNFASFEAKAGEIVYIGDLYFKIDRQKYWVKGKVNLEVRDNYEEAIKYFRAKFPEYKNRPVSKRIAQTGVLLDNYDAGIFW